MSRYRWAWSAALLFPLLLTLGWMLLPAPPEPAGVVTIREAARPEAAPASPVPAASPTPPASPQRNAALADDSHYLVLREVRDRAWADRSEAALSGLMRGLRYVDRGTLAVKCTTSVCEVSGMAAEDPGSGSMAPTWEALDRDTAGDGLRGQGLERAATTLGTGRVREEFVVHYRRVAVPSERGGSTAPG
jgi:hypothetical protein